MDERRLKKISHKLSWLLRHGAGQERLAMDEAGWVSLDAVLKRLHLSPDEVDAVVMENNKQRYEVSGGKIRAAQGHSLEGMPVTQAGLEATWARYDGADRIWHGTAGGLVEPIAREGILRGGRTHVHLASAVDSRVGKRANVDVMLEVSASRLRGAGYEVFVSPNGVVLARYVPPECISGVRVLSRSWQAQRGALAALFGAPAL